MTSNPSILRQPLIVAVGRWQNFQKGTPILVRVLARALTERPEYSCRIIGGGMDYVKDLLRSMGNPCEARIKLAGPVLHQQLASHFQEAQISLCTSHYESFHIASGEALCCGASIVGDIRISSMGYFCSAASGTLSEDSAVNNLLDALRVEMDAWQRGERDPFQISAAWTARLHPKQVAQTFLNLRQDKT